MLVGDWTSNRWMTMFSDQAELMLGQSANEIGKLLEHDTQAAEAIFNELLFQQKLFKVRTKIETYQVSLTTWLEKIVSQKSFGSSGCSSSQDDSHWSLEGNLQRLQQTTLGQHRTSYRNQHQSLNCSNIFLSLLSSHELLSLINKNDLILKQKFLRLMVGFYFY